MHVYGKAPAVRPEGVEDFVAPRLIVPPPECLPPQYPYPMDGNSVWGDCVQAGSIHQCMAAGVCTRENETYPTQDQVDQTYQKFTGATSPPGPGTDVAAWFSWWHTHSFNGFALMDYRPLVLGNNDAVEKGIWLCTSVGAGFNLPQSAEDEFAADQPWTVVPNSPIVGGHYVPLIGYDGTYFYGVSWAQVVKLTYDFVTTYADELWVLLLGELTAHHGNGRGINISALWNYV